MTVNPELVSTAGAVDSPAQGPTELPEEGSAIGARLRELREQSGISLRALARALGISASAVSQIERGQMQPSVNRLIAITTALGISLAEVFESSVQSTTDSAAAAGQEHSYVLARSGQVAPVHLDEGVVFRSLAPMPVVGIQFFESTYPPGSHGGLHGEMIRHEGYEVGHVTQGELTIIFSTERVVLRVGDSITFPCTVPHLLVNESEQVTVATWVITNPAR